MTSARLYVHTRLLVLLLACCVAAAFCARRAPAAEDVRVDWIVTPMPPFAGAATVGRVILRDHALKPVQGATLQVEGHMSHPGMAPVIAAATERGDGVYEVRLEFTMAGDWILLVTGVLPDGRRLVHRLNIEHVRPAE